MPLLKTHLRLLEKNPFPFRCPHCHDTLLPKQFEDHCATQHQLDSETHCAWCFGNTIWNDYTRSNRVDHLVACSASFLASRDRGVLPTDATAAKSPPPTIFDLTLMCPEKMFGDYVPLPQLPEMLPWPVHLPPIEDLSFQCPRINLAVACLHLYFETAPHDADWMHVMVKPSAYASFRKALDADAGHTRTLPFACFCTGGGETHRHFIVLSMPRHHFTKTTWKNIRCPKKNDVIKRDAIRSPMQLVYLMGSLAQYRSKCHFAFDAPPGPEFAGELNRYYVTTSLPSVYQLVLALQWDGGLLELVYDTYGSVDPERLAPVALSFNGLLGVRVRDLPGILKNGILPVARQFRPTTTTTPFFVHLYHGRKMYFERCETPILNWEEEQQQVTAEGEKDKNDDTNNNSSRNVFCNVIGEAIFYPTPYQQQCIRSLKPLLNKIVTLTATQNEADRQRHAAEASVTSLKKTNKNWKRKYHVSEEQLKHLQKRHIEYLEKENDKLRKKLCGGGGHGK